MKEKSHEPASVHFKQCYATDEPSYWSVLCINNTNPPYKDIKKNPSPIAPVLRAQEWGQYILFHSVAQTLKDPVGAAELSLFY